MERIEGSLGLPPRLKATHTFQKSCGRQGPRDVLPPQVSGFVKTSVGGELSSRAWRSTCPSSDQPSPSPATHRSASQARARPCNSPWARVRSVTRRAGWGQEGQSWTISASVASPAAPQRWQESDGRRRDRRTRPLMTCVLRDTHASTPGHAPLDRPTHTPHQCRAVHTPSPPRTQPHSDLLPL